jgi:hypothetical protein
MEISLTEQESHELARAVGAARQVRQWRHYRAIQLLAEDQSPQQVATVLSCSLASIYNWAAAWQQEGHVGLAEAVLLSDMGDNSRSPNEAVLNRIFYLHHLGKSRMTPQNITSSEESGANFSPK